VSEVVSNVGDVSESEVIEMKSIQNKAAKGVATETSSSRPKEPIMPDAKKSEKAAANTQETAGHEEGVSGSEGTAKPDTDVSFAVIMFATLAETEPFQLSAQWRNVKERFEKKDKVLLDEYSDDINYLLVFVSVRFQYD
jgi:hypothetical protein